MDFPVATLDGNVVFFHIAKDDPMIQKLKTIMNLDPIKHSGCNCATST